ncbi:MAG TPA: glycosyltransferase family 39 protein [Bryobacteraceae bacterium]|nr:glycosyltransferase family 39 protein [Bryobacteraceae bacterium]
MLSLSAAWWCFNRGYTLYFGDAEAHLNIARRVLDSRTPGPEQLGTVWLPLPHLVMLPFVMRDSLWRSGIAGVIPSSVCFVLGGLFLFAAARRAYDSGWAAFAALTIFAINPNILYLQSTPMTEPLFLAALAALLWATLWFRDSQSIWAMCAAAAASNAASLTRYEGWILIPFVTLYLLIAGKRKWHAIAFGALASLGPLAWLTHNQYYYSNALEFYNGPWSALAIYHRQLAGGMQPYPGDHNWLKAAQYFFADARWVAGLLLLIAAAAGALIALARRVLWPLLFLALVPAFIVWSMHSSGTPIFVPDLWPESWYNTRYAVTVVPLAAFAAGALVFALPARLRPAAAAAAILLSAGVWLRPAICWKESQVNSEARRNWTQQAAGFLAANYRPGAGILYSFGDLTGILRDAGIPLREGLHEGNGPAWALAMARPDLALHEEWAVAFSGDAVATLLLRADKHGMNYRLRKQIIVKGAPVVEIYHREP